MKSPPNLKKIMLVDDDPDILVMAMASLEWEGQYTVLTCSSGIEALQRIPEELPDLIVLDVMMPQMDGADTLKGIRTLKQGSQTPVIFLTAKGKTAREEIGQLDCCGVLSKPFDPFNFAAELEAIWTASFD